MYNVSGDCTASDPRIYWPFPIPGSAGLEAAGRLASKGWSIFPRNTSVLRISPSRLPGDIVEYQEGYSGFQLAQPDRELSAPPSQIVG